MCYLYLGLAEEKLIRVRQAKERERSQKSLAQKRSELLRERPIVPNLSNVESKLKAMLTLGAKDDNQHKSDTLKKRNVKQPGKVRNFWYRRRP